MHLAMTQASGRDRARVKVKVMDGIYYHYLII